MLDEAKELYEQKAPTSEDLSAARHNRAQVASGQEDWATAINMYEANLELARQQGDSLLVANSANGLAELVVHIEGELERGTALTEEALEAARLTGSPGLLVRAWMQLGSVRTVAGDLEGAASALHKARAIEDGIGEDHLPSPGSSSWRLGMVAFLQGDLNQATDYVGKANRQLRRLEHIDPRRHAVLGCLQTLACIEAARSRPFEAAVLLGAAGSARLNCLIGPYASALVETAHSTDLHALGPDAFHRAFAEGSAMTFDAAIDFAARAIDTSQNSPDHRST